MKRMPRARSARLHSAGLLCAIAIATVGCESSSSEDDGCNRFQQKLILLGLMEDVYFWNDEPSQRLKYAGADVSAYFDALELLDSLLYRPDRFDRYFSFVSSIAAENQFFDRGEFAGFGISLSFDDLDRLVISQVFAGSPADLAGLRRGQIVLEIDARSIAVIEANEGIDAALGPSTPGYTATLRLFDPTSGMTIDRTLKKDVVDIDPVPQRSVFSRGAHTIGYLELRSFIDPAIDGLDEAFAYFQSQGVTDLVVDLRYNGGGAIYVEDFLNSLMAGPGNVGEIMNITRFNSANSYRNEVFRFYATAHGIDLDDIVFITTDSTASASEGAISSLQPWANVCSVGSRSFGKPVGQTGEPICGDALLRAVSFEVVNSDGGGGYFDGLPPDFPAVDDLDHALGDASEASLATALSVIETGACPVAPSFLPRATRASVPARLPGPASPDDIDPARRHAAAF